jgi:MFS family permease
MPATLSKDEVQAKEERRKEMKNVINMLGPCVFLVVTGGQLLNQSRPSLVLDICNGNQREAAQQLARMGGIGGIMEFLFNPIIGRLSDKFGRKPFLMLSPIVSLCQNQFRDRMPDFRK